MIWMINMVLSAINAEFFLSRELVISTSRLKENPFFYN